MITALSILKYVGIILGVLFLFLFVMVVLALMAAVIVMTAQEQNTDNKEMTDGDHEA